MKHCRHNPKTRICDHQDCDESYDRLRAVIRAWVAKHIAPAYERVVEKALFEGKETK